ncbi:hypothetical protein RF11_09704 [Thelohanellus kitauei]|uniref:Uncharacterized protein n=1 Tax=Thelohanellus kitauei TaxID=669202 RepID=A0A0C2MT10_THEKT|nr:hypothetical protein RF11_09704 [Thelohanellus kitauei]
MAIESRFENEMFQSGNFDQSMNRIEHYKSESHTTEFEFAWISPLGLLVVIPVVGLIIFLCFYIFNRRGFNRMFGNVNPAYQNIEGMEFGVRNEHIVTPDQQQLFNVGMFEFKQGSEVHKSPETKLEQL